MDRIPETLAFETMRLVPQLSDAERERGLQLLSAYKEQQARDGAPLFPSQEKARIERETRVRQLFQDRERHGFSPEDYEDFRKGFANAPEPDAARYRVLNKQFLGEIMGEDPNAIGTRYDALRKAYAAKRFGVDDLGEKAFFERVASKFDTEDRIGEEAQKAAMRGILPERAFADIAGPESGVDLSDKQREDFRRSFSEIARATSARLDPYRDTIRQAIADMQAGTGANAESGGDTVNYAEFAERLLDVPAEDRDFVLSAIATAGAGDGDTKGWLKKIGENFSRGVLDMTGGMTTASEIDLLEMLEADVLSGRIEGDPTDAARLLTDARAGILDAGIVLGVGQVARATVREPENLTEFQQAALAEIERRRDAVDLSQRLREIAENEIDPAKGEWLATRGLYAAARSIPYTLAAITPPGIAANAITMQGQAYHRFRSDNPDMDRRTAYRLATVAAPIQAGLEQISGEILLGRLPTLNRFFKQAVGTNTAAAKRFGTRLGAATLLEVAQENAQDLTPFAVQGMIAALDEDVPGVDWESALSGLSAGNQIELLFAVLPLSLIGAGVGTVNDYANGSALMSSAAELRLAGVSEERAKAISEAFREGRAEEAQAMLREDFRTLKLDQNEIAEVRAEAVTALRAEAQERLKAQVFLETAGVLPAMRRSEEGWSLIFQDGKKADYASHADADRARWEAVEASALNVADETRDLIRQLEAGLEVGREISIEFSPEEMTGERAVAEGMATPEALQQRQEIGQRIGGQAAPDPAAEYAEASAAVTVASADAETREISTRILGMNQSQWVDGVQKTTIRLFQGATPLTLVEEKLEADVARMLKSGRAGWLVGALREYERATGDVLFDPGKTDDMLSAQEIREAYSHLGTSYFVAKQGKGSLSRPFRKLAAEAMRTRIGGLLTAYGHFFRAVFRRAAKLRKASRDGNLSPELEAELARSLGIAEQQQFEAATEAEAERLATEMQDMLPAPPMDATDDAPFSIIGDYGMSHRPNDEGPRAFDLGEEDLVPQDVYDHPEWYSGMGPQVIRETMGQLRKVRGKPDADLTIYRSGPAGTMNSGDWVTLSREYARMHAMSSEPSDDWRVWSANVKAQEVRWSMDDLAEFGYFGNQVEATDTGVGFSAIAQNAGDFEARIAKMFDPWQRSPELRRQLAADIQRRAIEAARQWQPIAARLRSKADIERDRKAREADILGEKLTALGGELDPLGNEEFADARNNPVIAPLLQKRSYTRKDGKTVAYWGGRLESPSAYKARTGQDKVPDEYDGMGNLPSWMFGGTLRPDEAADELGLGSTNELWEAIQSAILTAGQISENVTAAQEKLRKAEREAREESKDWAKEQETAATRKALPRENLVAALRTLDAMISALPREVRGRIGGYVKLAQLATPEAMLKEINERADKIDREIETWLRKDLRSQLAAELAKNQAKRKAGKKVAGSQLGAEGHVWMDYARQVASLSPVAARDEVGRIELALSEEIDDARIAEVAQFLGRATMTEDEARDTLTEQLTIAEVIGGTLWGSVSGPEQAYTREAYTTKAGVRIEATTVQPNRNPTTAAQLQEALDLAESMRLGLRNRWLEQQASERERRDAQREQAKAATGSAGEPIERDRQARQRNGIVEKSRDALLNLLSWEGVARYVFGDGEVSQTLADAERRASNAKEDAIFDLSTALEDFITNLAGGDRFAGQRLRFRLAQKTKSVGGGDLGSERLLSELEIVDALMMWDQEDGQRHMIGHLDENGRPAGEWHYSQEWIDAAKAQLSPEAWEIMRFLQDAYGAEYDRLNPVHRDLYGLNLPRNPKYSPLSVAPRESKGPDRTDPQTGQSVGAGFSPGWLKTRGTAIAEPDFRDALQKYLGHTKEVEHWIAYAPFVREARAILANRSVGNAVQSAAGAQAIAQLRSWLESFEMDGVRDNAAFMATQQILSNVTGRAAAMALVGRVSTILVQSTQLGAALAEMPIGAYLSRIGRLFAGRLPWRDAYRSDYIQRRLREMPPAVQEAMRGLDTLEPSRLREATRQLGQLIAGADAFFTAGTFAIVRDYQLRQAAQMGMTGQEAVTFAENQAERVTDRIAQPTRRGARSFLEVSATNPVWRLVYAFASEGRKNLALMAMAAVQRDPMTLARAVMYVGVINSLGAAIIRNAWRDLRDDEDDEVFDERNWNPQSIVLTLLTDWMTGIPVFGEMGKRLLYSLAGEWSPSGTILDGGENIAPAMRAVFSDDAESDDFIRLAESTAELMGYFHPSAASVASWAHLLRDANKIRENVTGDN